MLDYHFIIETLKERRRDKRTTKTEISKTVYQIRCALNSIAELLPRLEKELRKASRAEELSLFLVYDRDADKIEIKINNLNLDLYLNPLPEEFLKTLVKHTKAIGEKLLRQARKIDKLCQELFREKSRNIKTVICEQSVKSQLFIKQTTITAEFNFDTRSLSFEQNRTPRTLGHNSIIKFSYDLQDRTTQD